MRDSSAGQVRSLSFRNPQSAFRIPHFAAAILSCILATYPAFAQPLGGREVTEDIFYQIMPIAAPTKS